MNYYIKVIVGRPDTDTEEYLEFSNFELDFA